MKYKPKEIKPMIPSDEKEILYKQIKDFNCK